MEPGAGSFAARSEGGFFRPSGGNQLQMKVRKVVRKSIDHNKEGIRVAGRVSAVVAANVNESGSQGVSASSRQRIVQSSSGTQIHEERIDASENEGGKDE